MENKYIEQASAFVSSYRRFQFLLLPEHQQDMIKLMNEAEIDNDGYAAITQLLYPESWSCVELIDGRYHYVLPGREMSVHELMWFYTEVKNINVDIDNREWVIDEIVLHLEFCQCSENFYPSLSAILLNYINRSITRGNIAVSSAIRNYMSMNGTTGIDEMLPFLDREDVNTWTKNTILKMMIRVIASHAGKPAPENLGGNRTEKIRNCVLRLLEQMKGCNIEESPNGAFMLNCFLIISMIGNDTMECCKEAFQMLKDCPHWFRSMFIREAGKIVVCNRHNIDRAIKLLKEVEGEVS